jgi:hypothetical protein
MATREEVVKLTIESAEAAKSVKEVRESLKAIRDQMLAVGDDSKEFHQLAAAAAELKDRVNDANEAMAAMHPDGFQSVTNFAAKASGAVQGVTGAMALFGGESEAVQQTMMKLQAAMALTQGLEAVKDLGKAWTAVNAIIRANPIAAIVTAVVALGAAVKEVVDYFNPLNTEARRLQATTERTTKETELRLGYLDNEIKLAQARGATEEEIYNMNKEQVQEKIKLAKLSLASAEATLKQQEAEKGILDYIGEAYIMMLKLTGQTEMANVQEQAQAARRKQNLQEYVDAVDQAKLNLDALITEEEIIEINHTNFLKDQYKERAKAQQEAIQQTHEVFMPIMQQQVAVQQQATAELQVGTFNAMEGVESRVKTFQERLLDVQARIYRAAANAQSKFGGELANSTQQLFGALADASKKNAKMQKAFAVVQATINTYQAATKALATLPPPASYVAAAAALVSGFVQVRNILSQNVENPSSSAGGGGGGMGLATINSAPDVNTAQQPSTLINEQGQAMNQQQQAPVYVAVTEIREVSNNVNVVENLARF